MSISDSLLISTELSKQEVLTILKGIDAKTTISLVEHENQYGKFTNYYLVTPYYSVSIMRAGSVDRELLWKTATIVPDLNLNIGYDKRFLSEGIADARLKVLHLLNNITGDMVLKRDSEMILIRREGKIRLVKSFWSEDHLQHLEVPYELVDEI